MRFKMMALAAAVSVALPAIAQTADPAAASAPKPKKEKKICRSLEPMPGSNMMRSICHTKAEWTAIDGTGEDAVANSGTRSADGAGNIGPGVH